MLGPVTRFPTSKHVVSYSDRVLGGLSLGRPPTLLLRGQGVVKAAVNSRSLDIFRANSEFETYAQNLGSETEDAREGIRAFVDKRPPAFRGR